MKSAEHARPRDPIVHARRLLLIKQRVELLYLIRKQEAIAQHDQALSARLAEDIAEMEQIESAPWAKEKQPGKKSRRPGALTTAGASGASPSRDWTEVSAALLRVG